MNTISFSNAFKSLMATLGAKTTDSNYAVPLVNKTSGAPQGFMDMSSLASVLGEKILNAPVVNIATEDGLNVLKSGNYIVHFTGTIPTWCFDYTFVEVIYQSETNILQRFVRNPTPNEVVYRYIKKTQSGTTVNIYKFTGTAI